MVLDQGHRCSVSLWWAIESFERGSCLGFPPSC